MSYFRRQLRRQWRLLEGDSAELLKCLPDNSFDAMVTDCPSSIGFMHLKWDHDKGGRAQWTAWLSGILKECYRVLKPGAYILIWALPRTSHWTATAVEDAGFNIREFVTHIFGTGFPKNLNCYKELEKRGADSGLLARYKGYGSGLKPSCEFWILARKPLEGTIANNVMRWGTGAINIDGCRIPAEQRPLMQHSEQNVPRNTYGSNSSSSSIGTTSQGRFPATLVLSHSEDCKFVEKAKQTLFGPKVTEQVWQCVEGCPVKELNEASRFFYCAKPRAKERNAGCEHLPFKAANEAVGRKPDAAALKCPRTGAGRTSGSQNYHPTLKSISLMRYLCRMIGVPGGLILDPFAGSGTTGCAARLEGFRFLGIEKEQDYAAIARARLAYWAKQALAGQGVPGPKHG